ncbi:MAG: hypothetical protein N2322_05935, partial [Terrimicrobiaceae bacterium]|nr:hypothetical protein [Terrimicrobiaceae bacterium]
MRPSVPILLILASHAAASAAFNDAPAVNADAVMRELDAIEKKQQQALDQARRAALETLRSGLASPSAAASLYEQAVEATRFEGLPDKVPAFLDWKKRNADLLRSSEFGKAAQFHLRYLILSIERAASTKAADFAKPSLAYASDLATFLLGLDRAERHPGEL